jgi:hypothetical protein
VTTIINDVLLVFIILELVESAREQLSGDRRVSPQLVEKLLIIGVLASIRHILTVGAELAVKSDPRLTRLWLLELGVNAVAVLVLIGGLVLVHRLYGAQGEHAAGRVSAGVEREPAQLR